MTINQAKPRYAPCIMPSVSTTNIFKGDTSLRKNKKQVRKLLSTVDLRTLPYLAFLIIIFSLPNLCLSASSINQNHNNQIIDSQMRYYQHSKKLYYHHLCNMVVLASSLSSTIWYTYSGWICLHFLWLMSIQLLILMKRTSFIMK